MPLPIRFLFKSGSSFAPEQFGVLAAGFISSFVVALLGTQTWTIDAPG
jgi:hypothetical protein